MALYPMFRMISLLVLLWTLLPFFCIFNFFLVLYRYLFSENVKGKVVLITGASSGIGEQMTYEYARRGASLVIVARRENLLKNVAKKARELGSPDVVPVCADVLNVDDCKRFVDAAVKHFGRLDHVVNNAGISSVCSIEDATNIRTFEPVMNVNFWGSIYPTYFAIPHLKRTKGKIFVNASAAAILHPPTISIYAASKAALLTFYETMRVELGPEISITTATLGFVDSEMTQGKHVSKEGITEIDKELADATIHQMPVMSSSDCAKAMVDAVCRKQRYVTEPKWCRVLFLFESICPELMEWMNRVSYSKRQASKMQITSIPPSQNKVD